MNGTRNSLVWLIVGGAPRSGTTALGTALRSSAHIALFHEYLTHNFFSALERFFVEEDRQSQFMAFERHAHLVPSRSAHGEKFARSIFRDVFPDKPSPSFIGTKTPSYEKAPVTIYPDWITPRIIHITRNPFDVTLSSVKKGIREKSVSETPTTEEINKRFHRWLSSWNYAVEHADDSNFLHIFYDDLLVDPVGEKARVAKFLDGLDDFDFSAFKPTQSQPVEERYAALGMTQYLEVIKSVAPIDGWLEHAKEKFRKREMVAYPLGFGSDIELTTAAGDGGLYVNEGFYPAETHGSWTKGKENSLVFSPAGFEGKHVQLSFEIVWCSEKDGKSRDIEILLNGTSLFREEFRLGKDNGTGRTVTMPVPDGALTDNGVCKLTFLVHNPAAVESKAARAKPNQKNDARELGIMIRKITFTGAPSGSKRFSFL